MAPDEVLISEWCASAGFLLSQENSSAFVFPELWSSSSSFSSQSSRIYCLDKKRHEPQLSDDRWSLLSLLKSARLLRPEANCTRSLRPATYLHEICYFCLIWSRWGLIGCATVEQWLLSLSSCQCTIEAKYVTVWKTVSICLIDKRHKWYWFRSFHYWK